VKRVLLSIALIATSALGLSCNVNDYCLNCAKTDGGDGDGMTGDGGDDGDNGDAVDAALCATPVPEVCNNKDDDCDGNVDEGTLPQVGDLCPNQVNECAGGVLACMNGALKCTKPPMAESCNNKDDDCDGVIDDGDPGGGVLCGTDMGECVAGTMHCVAGVPTCQGAVGPGTEACDGKDNNCNGMIDDGAPADPTVCNGNTNVGECNMGTPMCIGGNSVCIGAQGPTVELCDNKDQDCDGNVNTIDPNTNGFNLQTDPTNCGTCGHLCVLDNAVEGCAAGQCTILACDADFHDNDGSVTNGCEFGPCTIQGNEVCNGIDDDCDGLKDGLDPQMQTPPVATMCETQNECAGATVTCDGANGFKCVYPDPDVSQVNGVIQPETLCDGKDNDCDGAIDEGQPGLGGTCTRGQGECTTSGHLICDTANLNGPAICDAVTPGAGAPETCDGKDNDCNGVIDDNAALANLPGQEWITLPNGTTQMMKYEASHPDATNTGTGEQTTHACSRPGTLPWTNITYPSAVAVCSSMGARLCTEAEWQSMCLPDLADPVPAMGLTTNNNDFVFIEAEKAHANVAVGGRQWTATAPLGFNGITAMQVPDNGVSQNAAANAATLSPHLDYHVDLQGSTDYRVWLRMRSPAVTASTPQLRTHTAATATLGPVSAGATQVGDLVIVTTYSTTTSNAAITHALQSGFTQISSVDVDEGNDDARMSVAYKVATAAGAQTYQAYNSSVPNNWSGITVVRAGTYDVGTIDGVMSTSTGTGAPNPPQLTVQYPSVVLAMGAWHLGTTAQNQGVSAPSGYNELWEMGNEIAELSVASDTANAGSSPNPGSFGDNVTPRNTISATIAIGASTSRTVWVGLAQGTSAATNANGTFMTTSADGQWTWIASPQLTSASGGGQHTFSIYMREDGVMIDAIAFSRQNTASPTFDNVWAYESNPRTSAPQTCNGDEFDTAPPVPIAASPGGATASGTTATFTTTSSHRLSVGSTVVVSGVANNAYNGTLTVLTTPTTTTFTATIATSNPAASGGGNANGDQDDMWASGTSMACHAEHGTNDVFDMSGNAKEWTQARVGGQNPLRGGSANNSENGLTCKLNFTLADNTFFFPNVGFRCCRQ
jgi:formylglycine-generating enzyme required for sulfatase activity